VFLIGPGGLLLVVPHLFAVAVSVLRVGLQKSTEGKLAGHSILQNTEELCDLGRPRSVASGVQR